MSYQVPIDEVRAAIMAGQEACEAMNAKHGGLVKPDISFFGERLPGVELVALVWGVAAERGAALVWGVAAERGAALVWGVAAERGAAVVALVWGVAAERIVAALFCDGGGALLCGVWLRACNVWHLILFFFFCVTLLSLGVTSDI